MRKIFIIFAISLFISTGIMAKSFRSPSMNGATGLISTPTANTGWENSEFGVDVGFTWIDDDDSDEDNSDDDSTIGTFTVQLFKIFEIGGMYDMQGDRGDDWLINMKLSYGMGNSNIAIGGNYQDIDPNDDIEDDEYNGYQIYLAATYNGDFFNMPAETTIVIGKSFFEDENNEDDVDDTDNIDFSMGFDLDFMPSVFNGYIHWINDFANYSYSFDPTGVNMWRAAFNTGIRGMLPFDKVKITIDAVIVDALDANRDFALKGAAGISF